ncbi:carbonic anhydrase 2 [Kordia sp. SMS9]|uniref:carbonic anhydrase n=1 Tax=Kordia sp. SMS9 TaxID=2282170 RepID=UPI000E0D6469|nr:carbonic anhydrase [Kordia sp. SMS9]AXG70558.1 carbonic anhydrase 2 [Kordia sp. SMS9]
MSAQEELECEQNEKCLGDFKHRNNPKKVLKRLKSGNRRFALSKKKCNQPVTECDTNDMIHPNQSTIRRKNTAANGQKPFAIILSCADSRVPPELIFDTGIGDLFVVRVAGNIANTSSIASIEFAVAKLHCKFILVLGHEGCGAVKAAMSNEPAASENLEHLVEHILPAVYYSGCESKITDEDYYNTCKHNDSDLKSVTKRNVANNADALVYKSKIIRESIRNSGVEIYSGYYKLKSGKANIDTNALWNNTNLHIK